MPRHKRTDPRDHYSRHTESKRRRRERSTDYTRAGEVTVTNAAGETRTEAPYDGNELARVRAGARRGRSVLTPKTRAEVLARDRWRCRYCGARVGEGAARYEIDHVVPVAHGGSSTPANLVTACRACNQTKGTERWQPRPLGN